MAKRNADLYKKYGEWAQAVSEWPHNELVDELIRLHQVEQAAAAVVHNWDIGMRMIEGLCGIPALRAVLSHDGVTHD